jgi:hypothetical protein
MTRLFEDAEFGGGDRMCGYLHKMAVLRFLKSYPTANYPSVAKTLSAHLVPRHCASRRAQVRPVTTRR